MDPAQDHLYSARRLLHDAADACMPPAGLDPESREWSFYRRVCAAEREVSMLIEERRQQTMNKETA